MRLFYNTGIYLLDAGLHAAGMFNDKARLWCRGRRRIFSRMAEAVAGRSGADGCPDTLSVCGAEAKERTRTGDGSDHCTAGTDLIWFHCASLGEFEQGRPVIEAFRAAHPGWKILLTSLRPDTKSARIMREPTTFFTCRPIRRAMPGGSFRFSVRRSPYSSNTSFGPTTCSHCSAAVRGLT